jgi:hypothetical protein
VGIWTRSWEHIAMQYAMTRFGSQPKRRSRRAGTERRASAIDCRRWPRTDAGRCETCLNHSGVTAHPCTAHPDTGPVAKAHCWRTLPMPTRPVRSRRRPRHESGLFRQPANGPTKLMSDDPWRSAAVLEELASTGGGGSSPPGWPAHPRLSLPVCDASQRNEHQLGKPPCALRCVVGTLQGGACRTHRSRGDYK